MTMSFTHTRIIFALHSRALRDNHLGTGQVKDTQHVKTRNKTANVPQRLSTNWHIRNTSVAVIPKVCLSFLPSICHVCIETDIRILAFNQTMTLLVNDHKNSRNKLSRKVHKVF